MSKKKPSIEGCFIPCVYIYIYILIFSPFIVSEVSDGVVDSISVQNHKKNICRVSHFLTDN